MQGHVRKRGDKWYYSFEASSVDGKRKRIERVGGRTKKEAEAACRKAIQEYEYAGVHTDPNEISISDYMDFWLNTYAVTNCKYNTIRGYENIIKLHVKPAFGHYKLRSLSPALLQQFINDKASSGFSRRMLINIMSLISSSMKMAVYPYGYIKENPAQYIKIPKIVYKEPDVVEYLTSEDMAVIFEKFPLGHHYHIPLIIGYHTGMRVGEITGLTWNDIDFVAKTINVDKILIPKKEAGHAGTWHFASTKTEGSNRVIAMGDTLASILKKYKIMQTENRLKYGVHYFQYTLGFDRQIIPLATESQDVPLNLVCTKENGYFINSSNLKTCWTDINKKLGIRFNFHGLRHTHATMLIENGANLKDVQDRLGHTNFSTTMNTYAHVTQKMKTDTVNIFEKAIGGLPTK